MAVKKDKVNLTYDALWFKIFMDSVDIKYYGREIFIAPGLAGDKNVFMQLLGNLGAYAREKDFDKDISLVVIPDKMMKRYKDGDKDEFIQMLEDRINASNTPYRKLKFITEELALDVMKTRASSHYRQNQKDLNDKSNSSEMNKEIEEAIEEDNLMLDMIKRYKQSAKEPIQQRLF